MKNRCGAILGHRWGRETCLFYLAFAVKPYAVKARRKTYWSYQSLPWGRYFTGAIKNHSRVSRPPPVQFFYGHFRALAQSRPFPDLHCIWVCNFIISSHRVASYNHATSLSSSFMGLFIQNFVHDLTDQILAWSDFLLHNIGPKSVKIDSQHKVVSHVAPHEHLVPGLCHQVDSSL
jgi:hypothetical protein